MSNRIVDHRKETVVDEVCKQIRSRGSLECFGYGCALVEESHSVILLHGVHATGTKQSKKLIQKGRALLEMLNDVDLVEEDEGVENRKGWVIEDSGKNDVFQVLQSPCVADFAQDYGIFDGDHFLESVAVVEILAMVCLVGREFGVICRQSARHTLPSATRKDPFRTLQSTNHPVYYVVANHQFYDRVIVQQYKGLHDVAESMEVRKALEVFGHGDEGEEFQDKVVADDELADGVASHLRRSGGAQHLFDLGQVPKLRLRKVEGVGDGFKGVIRKRIICIGIRISQQVYNGQQFAYVLHGRTYPGQPCS